MTKNTLRDAVLSSLLHDISQVRDPSFKLQELKLALIEALDKYAFSIVEQSVPAEMQRLDLIPGVYNELDSQFAGGHDHCRTKTLENARRICGEKEYTNNLDLLTDKLKEAGFTEYRPDA